MSTSFRLDYCLQLILLSFLILGVNQNFKNVFTKKKNTIDFIPTLLETRFQKRNLMSINYNMFGK